MYKEIPQHKGMRPLPPEETGGVSRINLTRATNLKPRIRPKAPSEIRNITRKLEAFAATENPSDREALNMIEEARGVILQLRLKKSKSPNRKAGGRHNSPHTSKKLPPKYNQH